MDNSLSLTAIQIGKTFIISPVSSSTKELADNNIPLYAFMVIHIIEYTLFKKINLKIKGGFTLPLFLFIYFFLALVSEKSKI